ncbi:hypothetical protein [Flavobacterium sp. KACC 22761]|uniref:hypothetical protein n=1 Tax=Flavobacterium sp. KACC 22761 TaxID=3092665 RepID=UPI002A75DBC0|nr:hypothetical protein [Flavobacterium sp. KACC 22761]WPO78603.1 hypothetical protein SCB73_20295 [Flavobacterium sp. KACC 22761]
MRKLGLLFLLLIFSCSKKQEVTKVKSEDKPVDFFDPITLGSTGVDSNLKINAFFSECGEWGGHYEELKIFAKESNYKDYFLNYTKTSIDCDKRDSKGRNLETIVAKKTIKLTDSDKKTIISYIKRMVESKVAERFPGNAGNSFSIINADSTLVIKVYDYNSKNLKSYNQLLDELKLLQK